MDREASKRNNQWFENELVLENIFSHLPTSDLLTCRLICHKWERHSYIYQRIGNETKISLDNNPSRLSKLLRTICEMQVKNRTQLYKKFTILNIPYGQPILQDILEASGPFIVHLSIAIKIDPGGFKKLIFYQLPNLHTLCINNLSYDNLTSKRLLTSSEEAKMIPNRHKLKCLILQEVHLPITKFLIDIFTVFCTINEIKLKCDNRSDWDTQAGIWKENSPIATSVFDALKIANNYCKLNCIKCGVLNQSHILTLTKIGEKGLKLEEFEMYCPANDVLNESLRDFLQTQSSSLRKFRVLGNVKKIRRSVGILGPGVNNVSLLMPNLMEKLEEFQLSGRDKDNPIPLYIPKSYGNCFRNLSVLIIKGSASSMKMDDYFPHAIYNNSRPCLTLRKLIIPSEIRNANFPRRLLSLFPNVINLEIKAPDNAFLQELWKCYENLEVLKITTSTDYFIDSGMTGLDENVCESLKAMEIQLDIPSRMCTENLTSDRNGIHNLKKLRRLEIIVENENVAIPSGAISDISAYFSFRRMKHLRFLSLITCCWYDGPATCNYITTSCQLDLIQELKDTMMHFTPVKEGQCRQ